MYELVPDAPKPPTPTLPGSVRVSPDHDELLDVVGNDLFMQAVGCVRSFGDFHLVLSGSTLLEAVYRRLLFNPTFRDLPWTRTQMWVADEEPGGGGSRPPRQTLVREWFADNTDLPDDQLHAIRPEHEAPAHEYQARLHEVLGWREKGHDRPDFVLLAVEPFGIAPLLGPDAEGSSRLVVQLAAGGAGRPIFAVSPELIRASRCVGVLVPGESAAGGLASVADRLDELIPAGGELRWYLDADTAASAARVIGARKA